MSFRGDIKPSAPGRLCQHNYWLSIFKYFGENYAGIIGTFSHLNGNNRQRTVLRLIIFGYVMGKVQFHFSVAYSAPVECENNTGIIGNLKRINRLILGNKEWNNK